MAYFNAGVRVVDLSDPYNLREIGFYVPKTNHNSHPVAEGQKTAIQINDVRKRQDSAIRLGYDAGGGRRSIR